MSDIMTSTGLRKPPTASCTDWNGHQWAICITLTAAWSKSRRKTTG